MRTMALGLLLLPLGCIISVDDDPDDDPDGFAGNGGSYAGSAGSGGGGASGSGGSAGLGGSGGGEPIDVTCDPETDDDACLTCLKQSCCEAWLGCDDQTCADEWLSVTECVASEEFPDSEILGMCISASSTAGDSFVQANTQGVIDCAVTPAGDAGISTLCSTECFGTDIFLP